jgi:hypothetical protein
MPRTSVVLCSNWIVSGAALLASALGRFACSVHAALPSGGSSVR